MYCILNFIALLISFLMDGFYLKVLQMISKYIHGLFEFIIKEFSLKLNVMKHQKAMLTGYTLIRNMHNRVERKRPLKIFFRFYFGTGVGSEISEKIGQI